MTAPQAYDEKGMPIPPAGFLQQPLLYISGIFNAVTDEEIVGALEECLKVRIKVPRQGSKWAAAEGTVEFSLLYNAEKAYAILHNYPFHTHKCLLHLSHNREPAADPKASARLRLIKMLPDTITPGRLFDLFRPYGPIYRIALHYTSTPVPEFKGTAIIEYFNEVQAQHAQEEMHCANVDGLTIAVEEYDERRDKHGRTAATGRGAPPAQWAQAPAFVPNGGVSLATPLVTSRSGPGGGGLEASRWAAPSRQASGGSVHAPPSPAISQMGSPTGPNGEPMLMVDPCNLFINNLSADVDSGELFNVFKRFGHIASARVMKNELGNSRGFGFVSFSTEEATATALREMDGAAIGWQGQKVTVGFHQLKKHKEGRTKLIPVGTNGGKGAAAQAMSRSGSVDLRNDSALTHMTAGLTLQPNAGSALTTVSAGPAVLNNVLVSYGDNGDAYPSNQSTPQSPALSTSRSLSPTSEKEQLRTAVLGLPVLKSDCLEDVVGLLSQLPRKDIKMCLFNAQFLAQKVVEANEVLEADDEPARAAPQLVAKRLATPPTGAAVVASLPTPDPTPARPSSADPAAPTAAPAKVTPEFTTVESLSKLSAKDFIDLAFSFSPLVQPSLLHPVHENLRKEADAVIDELAADPLKWTDTKVGQHIGSILFKVMKQLKLKESPQKLIKLVQVQDRRALLHTAYQYPEIFRLMVVNAPK